jgi:hypothetical protein
MISERTAYLMLGGAHNVLFGLSDNTSGPSTSTRHLNPSRSSLFSLHASRPEEEETSVPGRNKMMEESAKAHLC